MNDECCTYELNEEQLDDISGGSLRGSLTAIAIGAPFGILGSAFTYGVYRGMTD